MIFNNLGFNDLKIELFSLADYRSHLAKKFCFVYRGNDLKVAFCHIDFYPIKYFSILKPEISPLS